MNIYYFFFDAQDNVRVKNVLVALFLLIFICGPLSYYAATGLGWIEKPAKVLSVNNVEKEYEWFYSQQATVREFHANVVIQQKKLDAFFVQNGQDSSKWTQQAKSDYAQLTSIRAQQEILYNGACATYQARWDNIFHNVVAPRDIPRDCTLIGE